MATCRACEEYDYDVACAERSLVLRDTPREQAHHQGRHRGTETSMAIRRDQSAGLVRQGSVHHSYECRGRDLCYVSSRREGDYLSMADTVRRNNRRVDDGNRKIRPGSEHSQVHPKLRCDGTYPIDFPFALRVEQFEAMDMRALDRILISYGLLCTFTGQSRDIKRRKLWRLFEFLGADGLTPDRNPNYVHGVEYGGAGSLRHITW